MFYRTRQTQVTRALKAMDSGDNRIDLPCSNDSRGADEMQPPLFEVDNAPNLGATSFLLHIRSICQFWVMIFTRK
jgi:hypothetical protein